MLVGCCWVFFMLSRKELRPVNAYTGRIACQATFGFSPVDNNQFGKHYFCLVSILFLSVLSAFPRCSISSMELKTQWAFWNSDGTFVFVYNTYF